MVFIAIHVGARSSSHSLDTGTRDLIENALTTFRDRLALGLSAVDAVEEIICKLEVRPLSC